MAERILSAQQLLKEKGFEKGKFNTNLFMQDVADYFLENEVSSKLLLIPSRFVEIPDTDDVRENPQRITAEDRKNGFKTQTAHLITTKINIINRKRVTTVIKGDLLYKIDLYKNYWMEYNNEDKAGILLPRIIIDKPFFDNAVHTLRYVGGYVAERKMRKGLKTYDISLL